MKDRDGRPAVRDPTFLAETQITQRVDGDRLFGVGSASNAWGGRGSLCVACDVVGVVGGGSGTQVTESLCTGICTCIYGMHFLCVCGCTFCAQPHRRLHGEQVRHLATMTLHDQFHLPFIYGI